LYHRVAEPEHDPWDLCVSPENFHAQMAVLGKLGPCLKVRSFADTAQSRAFPSPMFAVTFDDGYRDNLVHALPILTAARLPATVYVTTGTIGTGRQFWWDTLARVFLASPLPRQALTLEVAGKVKSWTVTASNGQSHRDRQKLLSDVWATLLPEDPDDIERAADIITSWAGLDRQGPQAAQPMDRKELQTLAASDLIEIGAHTRNHRPLSMIDKEARIWEITQSRTDLEAWLGTEIASFSYPYGKTDAETAQIVRDAGFANATTVVEGLTTGRSDPFLIPRIQVKNWSGAEFERQLMAFTGGNSHD